MSPTDLGNSRQKNRIRRRVGSPSRRNVSARIVVSSCDGTGGLLNACGLRDCGRGHHDRDRYGRLLVVVAVAMIVVWGRIRPKTAIIGGSIRPIDGDRRVLYVKL